MATPIAGLKTMPTNATKNEAIFNEDMILLEALTYRGVVSRSLLDPSTISSPAPSNGTIYLVPDGSPNAVGDWASHGGDVAVYYDGWRYLPPAEGLTLWVSDESQIVQYRSSVWVDINEGVISVSINTQTGTAYTLALSDANNIVEMNSASANVLTIPTNAAIPFTIGTLESISQEGVGATTITADTGVTLNGVSAGSTTITDQYSAVSIYKRGTDDWRISGAHGGVA